MAESRRLEIEEKILFAFGGVAFVCGFYLAVAMDQNLNSGVLFAVSLGLSVLAAVGPRSITKAQYGDTGFSLERTASLREQEASLSIAEEYPTLSPANIERITKNAERKYSAQRTDADYLVLGMDAIRNGDHELSLQYAHAGLSLPSSSNEIRATLIHRVAHGYRALGLTDLAIQRYRDAIDVDPTLSLPHYDLGVVFNERGKIYDAIREYEKAIELDPNYAEPHNNLGNVFMSQEKIDDAIREYKKAIGIDPFYTNAHYNLGIVFMKQGEFDNAIREYQRAIEIDPDFAQPHYNLGIVFANQEKFDDAIRAYEKAIEIDPNYADARRNLERLQRAN